MEGIAQAFDAVTRLGILPAAFFIGSTAFFIALAGYIPFGNGHNIPLVSRLLLGFFGILFALAGLGGALFSTFVATNSVALQAEPTSITTMPILQPTIASVEFPADSCQWLQNNFSNSPQAVKESLGISTERDIRLFYEVCALAPNGFVLSEGQLVTLQVPQGGCIDSDDRAVFSGETVPESHGGRRAYEGTVTAFALTYRVRGCELRP